MWEIWVCYEYTKQLSKLFGSQSELSELLDVGQRLPGGWPCTRWANGPFCPSFMIWITCFWTTVIYSILHINRPPEFLISHLQVINSCISSDKELFPLLKKGNIWFTIFYYYFSTHFHLFSSVCSQRSAWTNALSPVRCCCERLELEENIDISVIFPNSPECYVQKTYHIILINTRFSSVIEVILEKEKSISSF